MKFVEAVYTLQDEDACLAMLNTYTEMSQVSYKYKIFFQSMSIISIESYTYRISGGAF